MRVTRRPNLTVLEVPGFGRPKMGAFLFLLVGLTLGVAWGYKAKAFIAIQLVSPTSVASMCSLITRRPLICMATASGKLGEMHYVHRTRFARLRLWLLRRATVVVAQNPAQAADLEEVARPGSVRVLPNPVEVPELPRLDGRPAALFAGRFSEEKDLVGLAEAWKHVIAERPEARLTLVGEGGAYRSVEEQLRSFVADDPDLSTTISFPGWVTDVRPYLLSHDLFVFPSLSEGMSNALLEAVAHRRVIVASDIPGNRAVLGDDYPLFFPPGDREALASAIKQALDNEELRTIVRAQLEERVVSFSASAVAVGLAHLIPDVERCK
jgi:glycosyltransferase involved in cell wall biosynthesis